MKFTSPVKPPIPEMIRVVEADPPCESVREEGYAKRLKSVPMTCTNIVMFSAKLLLVAVIST